MAYIHIHAAMHVSWLCQFKTCRGVPHSHAKPTLYQMPRAIVSPSVLASDFGQLTAECKRMMKGGAEWLHMGSTPPYFIFYLG